ncbi:threonylcarbamoyl-AMP synthase [Candidatus Daviesbacteria bacterium]|nr:threonylcarbamoyl-AMP synthase [Candidatus Daviesbacteria bacterium]
MSALDLNFEDAEQIVKLLQQGKVGVMPTDTIYGLVGSALNPQAVEEIYLLRKRDSSKPMIILISSLEDLLDFDIVLTNQQKEFLNKIWPNPVSVILPCPFDRFFYLHRGKKSLAFRMPDNKNLLKILQKTGSLVAPSANIEKQKPAETIEEAKGYFNDQVAFYADEGQLKSIPSTIIRLYEDGTKIVLREGSYKV